MVAISWSVFSVKGRPNAKKRKRIMDSDEVRGKEPSNHSSREILPLPPPLRKGSGEPNPRKFGDHQSHLVRAAHPRHYHHDHQQERQAVKKQRRHSEQDMTKRTLDSRMQTAVKGEREEHEDGEEEEELDVEDYGEGDDEEERGVSPPTQTENVPPPPPPSAPARYAQQGT